MRFFFIFNHSQFTLLRRLYHGFYKAENIFFVSNRSQFTCPAPLDCSAGFDWFVHWDRSDPKDLQPAPLKTDLIAEKSIVVFNDYLQYKSFFLLLSLLVNIISISIIVSAYKLNSWGTSRKGVIEYTLVVSLVYIILLIFISGGIVIDPIDVLFVKYLFLDILDLAEETYRAIPLQKSKVATIITLTSYISLLALTSIICCFATFSSKSGPSSRPTGSNSSEIRNLQTTLTLASLFLFSVVVLAMLLCNWSFGLIADPPRTALQDFSRSIGVYWGVVSGMTILLAYALSASRVKLPSSNDNGNLVGDSSAQPPGSQNLFRDFISRVRKVLEKILLIIAPALAAPLGEWLSMFQFLE